MRSKVATTLICSALLMSGCAAGNAVVKTETPLAATQEASAKPVEGAVKVAEAAKKIEAPVVNPDEPVARVNGTTIARKELDRALAVLVAQNRINPGSTADAVKDAQKAALEQLIFAELIYSEGLKAAPADLDKQVEARMTQNKERFGTPEEFENAIKESGISEKELTEITKKDLVITNFIETKIAPKVVVTDEEAKKFYDDNKAGLSEEPQVKASHILIGVESAATAGQKEDARKKAESILKELKAGRDFAEAAKAYSTCPSKEQGGDLGFFGKGQMVPAFEQAAFSMKPGDVSEIVETQFGYHIIKVTDKKDAEPPKFEELKEKIVSYLKGQKTQKSVFDFVSNLRKEAKVDILL